MAGAGFKTFNTGDVLTASDVNTYLMQQTVMVFADSSARTTALGANVAEGMISYLKDTNAVEVYDGSNWVSSDDPNAIQNTIVDAKGDLISATAADTPARLAVGTNGQVLTADSSTATGLKWATPSVGTSGFWKNPVLNSNMSVWQRGTSVAVSGSAAYTFAADRWGFFRGAYATGLTVSRQATGDTTNLPNIQYSQRVQRNSGNTGTQGIYLQQTFESVNSIPFAGKQVTFSFYARRGANFSPTSNALSYYLTSGTGTDQSLLSGFTGSATPISGTATLTTTWQRFSGTGTISSSATQLGIGFDITPTGTAGTDDWYEITGVQIEVGSSATDYYPNGNTYQAELAACQRYFLRYQGSASGFNSIGTGNCIGTSSYIFVPFKQTMRTVPSFSYSGTLGSSADIAIAVDTDLTPTSISVDQFAVDNATLFVGIPSKTNGLVARLFSRNANGQFNFSAEL